MKKSFDPYTKKILLESIKGPGFPGSFKRRKTKRGGMGEGAPSLENSSSYVGTPEQQTLYGRSMANMPSGSNWERQVAFANYKNLIDQAFSLGLTGDGVMGTIGNYVSAATYPAKQAVKALVAQSYLTGQLPTGVAGVDKETINQAKELLKNIEDEFENSNQINPSQRLTSKSGTLATAPSMGTQTMSMYGAGPLGSKVATELVPKLALLGYDPLDWVTKAFGADAMAQHVADLANKPRKSALGAGGYLSKGISKGIY
jgi:hypothetical protein